MQSKASVTEEGFFPSDLFVPQQVSLLMKDFMLDTHHVTFI